MYIQRLGDAVKEARTRRDLSQNTLAERTHVSLRTISDIENYRANPRLDSLCSLASYLNISVDAVIKDRKENNGSSTMQQILEELDTCSEEEQEIVLQTLRGLLKGLHTRTETPHNHLGLYYTSYFCEVSV